MNGTGDIPTQVDGPFEAALGEYLRRLDRGEKVDREAFVAGHPDVAAELRSYLATADMLERTKRPTTDADSESVLSVDTKSGIGSQETLPPDNEVSASVKNSADDFGSVGQQFGRYRIRRVLGQGAMGIVYLAHDMKLDRQVALKIPKFTQSDGPELIERFFREARSAAALHHRNICPLLDMGEIDGTHYITMTYIDGRPLSDFVKPDKPLPLRQVAGTVRKLASALALAHERGVIHRDLKPANIFIDRSKEPVIMDFGLARRINQPADARITQSGALIGSPAYMSPEQVESQLDAIGPTTDVYSLGVILYELLTGRLPFQGSIAAVIGQILAVQPKEPSGLRADVDPQLEAICMKMMAKKIVDRYASMQEVAEALTAYLKDPQRNARQPQVAAASELKSVETEPDRAPAGIDRGPAGVRERTAMQDECEAPLHAKLQGRRREPPKAWIATATALLAVGLIYAAVTLFIRVGNVDVKVEIDDPSLAVKFNGRTVTFEGSGQPIRLKPGDHKFAVERDGLEVETDTFTVKKNGKNILRVSLVEGKVVVLKDGQAPPQQRVAPNAQQDEKKLDVATVPPVDPTNPPAVVGDAEQAKRNPQGLAPQTAKTEPASDPAAINRRAAEWVLSMNGFVEIEQGERERRRITPRDSLPAEPFRVVMVNLYLNRNATDEGMTNLKGLPDLRNLNLGGASQLTHQGLMNAGLADLQTLEDLGINAIRVNDATLDHVAKLSRLRALWLDGVPISDDGLQKIAGLQELRTLSIPGTPITDAGLKHLASLSKLQILRLTNARNVTDEGVAAFRGALPNCRVDR